MNILNIAWKEIKTGFRDRRTLFFMLAFPIVLMLVLGTALTNAFTTTMSVDDIHVLYKDTTEDGAFQQFITGLKKSGVHFKEAEDRKAGETAVKQSKYDGYVEVTSSGIELYINSGTNIEGSILQGMLSSYVDKYNIASEIVKVAPEKLEAALSRTDQDDYIQDHSIQPDKQPGSMDYYAIVITTMIVLYGAMSASSLITSERSRKTADRLIAAPVRKAEIFVGKVLGNLVSNSICVVLVVMLSKFLFHANWGDHMGLVFLVLLTQVIFAVSLGLGLSMISKTSAAPRVILMLFVQLASFFGGSYFKIDNPEGVFKFITDLSPLTWMNAGLTKLIYANDFSAAVPAMLINLGGALLFLLVSIISLQRREGL